MKIHFLAWMLTLAAAGLVVAFVDIATGQEPEPDVDCNHQDCYEDCMDGLPEEHPYTTLCWNVCTFEIRENTEIGLCEGEG